MDEKEQDGAEKPSIIDLDANAVIDHEAAQPDAAETTAFVPPIGGKRRRVARYALPFLAVIAGAVAGGWLYRDYLASYWPTPQMKEMSTRVQRLEEQQQATTGQMTSSAQLVEQLKGDIDQFETNLAGVKIDDARREKELMSTSQKVAAADGKLSELLKQTAVLQKALAIVPAPSKTQTTSAGSVALASLVERVDALERDLAALQTDTAKESVSVAPTVALSNLVTAVRLGGPFETELARLREVVGGPLGSLEELAHYAEIGHSSVGQLAKELRDLSGAFSSSSAPQQRSDEGIWNSIRATLSNIVTIREVGSVDWAGLALQGANLVDNGKLQDAVRLLENVSTTLPEPMSEWLARARTRVKIDDALFETTESVVRQQAAR